MLSQCVSVMHGVGDGQTNQIHTVGVVLPGNWIAAVRSGGTAVTEIPVQSTFSGEEVLVNTTAPEGSLAVKLAAQPAPPPPTVTRSQNVEEQPEAVVMVRQIW